MKLFDSGYCLKVKTKKKCVGSLAVEHERKRRVEDDFKVMGLNNRKNRIVIYLDGENLEEHILGGKSGAQPAWFY